MRAGFAKANITPPPGTRMLGFGGRDRTEGCKGVHDPLYVRALYLEPGDYPDHMTICRKAGTSATAIFSSNGSEAGPDPRSLHYRSDLTGVFRHPALL